MRRFIFYISRGCCLFLVLHLFIVSVHTEVTDMASFDLEDGEVSITQQGNYGYSIDNADTHKKQEHIKSENNGNRKIKFNHHNSIPCCNIDAEDMHLSYSELEKPTPNIPQKYQYQFFEEINPPPPKLG